MTSPPTHSFCIFTKDRPAVLRRCLTSIFTADRMPTEVVVSDDSVSPDATRAVCAAFPVVRYVRGPKRGICPNRNFGVRQCTGDFVSLLDDDSILTPTFLEVSQALIAQARPKTIFTGNVLQDGRILTLANPDFLGFFKRPPGDHPRLVHLSCNIFPRDAFERAQFDEEIVYGPEEVDICLALLSQGYRIEYVPELVNEHAPPPRDTEAELLRERQRRQARFYTHMKRYLIWEKSPGKALAFALVAPVHQAGHHVRRGEAGRAASVLPDMYDALRRALKAKRSQARASVPRAS